MRTNHLTSYNQMDMGSPNFFSYNVDALVSMTNQQLEVSNELHMHLSRPCSPHGPAPHIPKTSLLIVTAVWWRWWPLWVALPARRSEPSVWASSYLYVLDLLSERPEGSPRLSHGATVRRARGLWL